MSDDSERPTKVDRRPSGSPQRANTTQSGPRERDSERIRETPAWLGDARYEPNEMLGRGGMGEVILANDAHIGRQIAVKVMRKLRAEGPSARARFLGEARVQAQLEHPAVVPVYDIGYDSDGSPYFTMKRVHGVTLDEALRRLGAQDPEAVKEYPLHKLLSAFQRVCLAVHFAHTRGVIHRDLKPSNVMLGEFGEVYVLDWGVAKRGDAGQSGAHEALTISSIPPPSETTEPTEQGVVLGTPGYMAPEQKSGSDEVVDSRADVYSLGVILRKLLAAQPDPPPELIAACTRATAVLPDDRYQSARELHDAIDAFLAGNRDLELRRALAAEHVEQAREFEKGLYSEGGGAAARKAALREVGRAIALDPTRGEALEFLVRLLTEPPPIPPREVLLELEAANRASRERSYPKAALAYLTIGLIGVPLAPIVGVRDMWLFVLPLVAWLASAALAGVARRHDAFHRRFPFLPVASALAIGMMSLLHGALLVVPIMAAVNAVCFVLAARPEVRRTAVGAACLAMIVPMFLEWYGVHPVSIQFESDSMRIAAGAIHLPPNGTYLFLGITYVVLLLLASRFVGAYRDALTTAETRNMLQAWQLRQLVPPEAQHMIVPEIRISRA
jgi:serine/threonine-protein kinase